MWVAVLDVHILAVTFRGRGVLSGGGQGWPKRPEAAAILGEDEVGSVI
jgi:hypothetical protein